MILDSDIGMRFISDIDYGGLVTPIIIQTISFGYLIVSVYKHFPANGFLALLNIHVPFSMHDFKTLSRLPVID